MRGSAPRPTISRRSCVTRTCGFPGSCTRACSPRSPGRAPASWGDEAGFRERFDIVALQRNLKAIGTFAYQSRERGKHGYLTYIEPTWESAFEALERLPRWSDASAILRAAAAAEASGRTRRGAPRVVQ